MFGMTRSYDAATYDEMFRWVGYLGSADGRHILTFEDGGVKI